MARPTFDECLAEAYEEHVAAFYDELGSRPIAA
jgi:hypothetical protein